MTDLGVWGQSPFAQAAGWALVHSLWEGALVAGMLAVGLAILRSARSRYVAACGALGALVVCFVATFFVLVPWRPAHTAARIPLGFTWPEPVSNGGAAHTRVSLADLVPLLTPCWLAGVVVVCFRNTAGWTAARRLRGTGVCGAPDGWQERLRLLAARVRIAQPVALLESCLVEVPVVMGHFRPAILLPVGLLTGLPAAQIEAILLHELAHIRRHDYLVNLIQTAVESLLFYHPAVWWISRVIRTEREHCCDDLAVALSGDAHGYAVALTALEQSRWDRSQAAALAATGGSLVKRIRRVLVPAEVRRFGMAPFVMAGVLMIAAAAGLVAWQSPATAPPVTADGSAAKTPTPAPPVHTSSSPTMTSDAGKTAAATPAPQPEQQISPYMKWLQEDVGYIITPEERAAYLALQTDAERRHFIAQVWQRRDLAQGTAENSPYMKWLQEDVAAIITPEERAAYLALQTNEEREHFIEQFWLRRDPTPGTPENEFKTEHYRRIAYANLHFPTAEGTAGWRTDRGRIYIVFGPPDERDEHPNGDGSIAAPYETWRYRYIQGIGYNVSMQFVDTARNGEFHMTRDPNPNDPNAQQVPRPGNPQ